MEKLLNRFSKIIIKDKTNVSSLLAILFALHYLKVGFRVVIFSPMPCEIVCPMLQNMFNLFKVDKELLKKIKLLTFYDNFDELKTLYGIEFLKTEINKILDDFNADVVVFLRFEMFFTPTESLLIQDFLKFITIKIAFGKKVILSFKMDNLAIKNVFDIADYFELSVEVDEKREGFYILNVKNLYSLENYTYQVIIDKETKGIQFKKVFSTDYSSITSFLLISNNEYINRLHQYLFSERVNLEAATTPEDAILKVGPKYDIIIYYPFEVDRKDFTICRLKREKNLKVPIIYLSPIFLKNIERSMASKIGCLSFSIPFSIEEYCGTLETLLSVHLYTHYPELNLDIFKKNKIICDSLDELMQYTKTFLNYRMFFTLFLMRYNTSDYITPEFIASKIRATDKLYIDTNEKTIFLLAYDIWKQQKDIIIDKIVNNSNNYEIINVKDAIDMFYEGKFRL